jgi:aspartokinase
MSSKAVGWGSETEFEKRRGVSSVEIRLGFAQAHVSHLAGDVVLERLRVLEAIGAAGISLDFLKLTPSGLSFLVKESDSKGLASAMDGLGVRNTIKPNRAILLVHAVNIRDEEGMLAQIVHAAISSSAKIDHISDMHDRLLMVVDSADADRLRERIEQTGGKS